MKFLFDIDDTLLVSTVKENGDYDFKENKEEVIKKLNKCYDRGDTVFLWTGRHWNHFHLTKKQLEDAGVKYHTLIMGKPPVDYYVEDKAITPEHFMELNL